MALINDLKRMVAPGRPQMPPLAPDAVVMPRAVPARSAQAHDLAEISLTPQLLQELRRANVTYDVALTERITPNAHRQHIIALSDDSIV
ncbi:hypothetical protein, partial [Serratia marcescens]|uniref:hypothetical protein n=1 Tax=Serratia marcescens TaxID=615 RepID=UPI001954A72E